MNLLWQVFFFFGMCYDNTTVDTSGDIADVAYATSATRGVSPEVLEVGNSDSRVLAITSCHYGQIKVHLFSKNFSCALLLSKAID